jgi:hypothetical protein
MASSPDPVSAVQQYSDAFNKGDATAMGAMCVDPMSILDGMAPHVWHGPRATQDWYKDVLVEGEHLERRVTTSPWASPCTRMLPARPRTSLSLPP